MELILASSSPRRLDLLKQIGIVPNRVIPADIDETEHKGELPRVYSIRIAEEKALKVYQDNKNAIILSADTTVVLGRRILQKAATPEEAAKFLKLLSGRRHRILSAVTVIDTKGNIKSKLVTSIIKFKRLSEEEINEYIASDEWQGKAGAYATQGLAAKFITYMSGSYSSIVGLPIHETYKMLKGAGYE